MTDSTERSKDWADPGRAAFHNPVTRDVLGGWRRHTPPIVESQDETYEHIIDKQGRENNEG